MKQIGTINDFLTKDISQDVYVKTRIGFIQAAFAKRGIMVFDNESNPHFVDTDAPIFTMSEQDT